MADPSELIDRIYDAALDQDLWPAAIEGLCDLVDCRAGALLHIAIDPVVVTAMGASGLDPAIYDRAHEIFGNPNDNPFIQKLPTLKLGVPVPRQVFIDDDTLIRNRIYTEFFKPEGLFYDITTPITVAPDAAEGIFLSRSRDAGPLTSEDAKTLRPWIPHLRRALLINKEIRTHRAGNFALAELLDRVSCGVALTRADGRIVMMNEAAEQLVEAADGLTFHKGRLQALSCGDNARLGDAIAMAAAGRGSDSLLVERPSGGRACLITTVPLSRAAPVNWSHAPAAAVLFSNPESSGEPPAGVIARLYGLSPAETTVALEAAQGFRPGIIAAKLKLSRNTIKTHLRQIYSKTGTSRQAELVGLLMTGASILRAGA